MSDPVRILLLADTHLGFDLPAQPRIRRRRRGHDFLANYAAALRPALDKQVDLVVHGGDVFNRSHVAATVAYQAFEPLLRVADAGVPVYLVPGNHERSRFPHLRFARHQDIHVFDQPRTFVAEIRGMRVALAGFPFERHDVRTRFADLLERTSWRAISAHARLLCLHQCVEGATVGPGNFTFTSAPDVIRGPDLPAGLAAVLSGHIHRHQVLTKDLRGRSLAAPVLYPGSIERTSIAEADEEKGFMIVEVRGDESGVHVDWKFHKLPARPLVVRELPADLAEDDLESHIRNLVAAAPADAVLTIRVPGSLTVQSGRILSAANLRRLAPGTMNVEIRVAIGDVNETRRRSSADEAALELPL
jgi:exonuclease SbcD